MTRFVTFRNSGKSLGKNVNRRSWADSVEIGEPLSINSAEFGQISY